MEVVEGVGVKVIGYERIIKGGGRWMVEGGVGLYRLKRHLSWGIYL